MKRLPPGVALLLLAPLLGELVSGHQTPLEFLNPVQFLLLALPYGFGAILCREFVVRRGKGWASLVLLGIAYGIYEEAIVARSIWDPAWAELGALRDYTFWKGVSWTYAAVLIHFHLLISIVSSVVLAELCYPERRKESWVGGRSLAACFVGLALWAPALWFLNPYVPPSWAQVLSWAAVIGLGVAAWWIPQDALPRRAGTATRPLGYGVLAAANMTAVFFAVFSLPELDPPWLPPWPAIFALVAALDLLAFRLVLRWSGNGHAWDDRHRLALVSGLLAMFLVFDVLKDVVEGFTGQSLVAAAATWGLWRLWRLTQAQWAEQAEALTPRAD